VSIPETARVFLVACDAADEIHAYYSESGEAPENWATVVMVWEATGADTVARHIPYQEWVKVAKPFLTADGGTIAEHGFPEE
jgi:hypothetical protein